MAKKEEWVAYREHHRQEGKLDDRLMVKVNKIEALCSVLEQMVNEQASLNFRQRGLLSEMLRRMADENDFLPPSDEADIGLLALPLATYINSCRT